MRVGVREGKGCMRARVREEVHRMGVTDVGKWNMAVGVGGWERGA